MEVDEPLEEEVEGYEEKPKKKSKKKKKHRTERQEEEAVDSRPYYVLKEETVDNIYEGDGDADLSPEEVFDRIGVEFKLVSDEEVDFDLIGAPTCVANALRRVMLAEVPTMAIEKILLYNNTGIMQDEVLCHRLGLIPIKADPAQFCWHEEQEGEDQKPLEDPEDTIKFKLITKCQRAKNVSSNSGDPDEIYTGRIVYSGDLEWMPLPGQDAQGPYRPVHDDIIITKLVPGHEIELEALCRKGVGKDHAKFSPVATATYRLLPKIILTEPIGGEEAVLLQSCFHSGVIAIDDVTEEAYVKNSRLDNGSREAHRHESLKDKVVLGRVKDHFIFSVESTGCFPAMDVISKTFQVLNEKIESCLAHLQAK